VTIRGILHLVEELLLPARTSPARAGARSGLEDRPDLERRDVAGGEAHELDGVELRVRHGRVQVAEGPLHCSDESLCNDDIVEAAMLQLPTKPVLQGGQLLGGQVRPGRGCGFGER